MQENNGVDRKQIILFMLFSLVMMGGMFFFQNRDAEKQAAIEAQKPATTQSDNLTTKPAAFSNLNDSVKTTAIQEIQLKNNELTLHISTLGGQISKCS